MNRLKELRKEKGLSQQALAKKIGVHYRTLQNWENGENQIKPDKAQQLADYFGVSVGYLLGYESDETLISELKNKLSTMTRDKAVDFVFTDEGNLLSELMYQADLRTQRLHDKKFRNFVKFLKDNVIILSDEEIENFFNMLLIADLNSGKKKELFEKVVDEDFTKTIDFLENNGYKIFFDKAYNDN